MHFVQLCGFKWGTIKLITKNNELLFKNYLFQQSKRFVLCLVNCIRFANCQWELRPSSMLVDFICAPFSFSLLFFLTCA